MNYLTNSQNRFKVLVSIATGRFFSVGALDDDDGSDRLTGVVSAASCVFCFLLPVVVFAFALLVVFAFAFAAFASLFFSPLRTLFLLEEELSLLESLEELLSEIFGLSSFSIPSFSSFSLSLISLFTLFSQASGMTSGWSSSIVGSVVSAISNAASISALAGFREVLSWSGNGFNNKIPQKSLGHSVWSIPLQDTYSISWFNWKNSDCLKKNKLNLVSPPFCSCSFHNHRTTSTSAAALGRFTL